MVKPKKKVKQNDLIFKDFIKYINDKKSSDDDFFNKMQDFSRYHYIALFERIFEFDSNRGVAVSL